MYESAHPTTCTDLSPICSTDNEQLAWQPSLPLSQRERTLANIHIIAERMQNPEYVLSKLKKRTEQSQSAHQGGALFSHSFASIAHFYLYLTRALSEQRWEEHAYTYLRLAAQCTHQYPLEKPGLFDGSSGFSLILSAFSEDEPRYADICHQLQQQIASQVITKSWENQDSSVVASDYNIVSGAAGILRYLISLPSPDALIENAILKLLGYLIWLSSENTTGCKNWFVGPERFPSKLNHQEYPDGYFNLGLSHGIPGPLAALALAWNAGYHIPGQQEAIRTLSQWIIEHQIYDEWGVNWPATIPLHLSYHAEQWQTLPPARNAWCYGAPGIASALWLAGDALEDEALHQLALQAIETVLQRPIEQRGISSPTICHGIAGLLTICSRFAHVTHSKLIHEHIPLLTEQILTLCDPNLPFVVQDSDNNGLAIDDPGFLTGSIGVALTLLATSTATEPQWQRALLIA
ncbi:MAG TPA: lanthionine synthetase C family protein [Dictyobacter sp.]|jgi:lantibiotic modifying enzyme|nr:lanthionine synthetase C family protein [Dictyobacter sp.]